MRSAYALPPAERELYSRLRLLLKKDGVLRGSLVVMRRRCGKDSCRCARDDDARHVSLYVATTVDGKRRMVYVPAAWEERVREWVERHKQIKDILEEISSTCLRRLQNREE